MKKGFLVTTLVLAVLLTQCQSTTPIPPTITRGLTTATPTVAQSPSITPEDIIPPPCQPQSAVDQSENRWISIGPYGGNIRDIVFDPRDPNILFAATSGSGVYRSDDGGDHWVSISSPVMDPYVSSLAIDPDDPDVLYAGTYNPVFGRPMPSVFKTNNQGTSWIEVAMYDEVDGLFNEVTSLVFGHQRLYMGSMAVLVSSEGDNWELLSDIGMGNGFLRISIDPDDENRLYAGSYQGGVFRSDDGGQTWVPFGDSEFAGTQTFVVLDPSRSTRLLAGGEKGLYLSEDDGDTWSAVHDVHTSSIVFDPLVTGRVWVGGLFGGLWHSSDAGRTWVSIDDFEGIGVWAIAVNRIRPDEIFVGTNNLGVFRSRDGGVSWQCVNTGITNTFISAIALEETSKAGRIYVGTIGNGVFTTDDLGSSWMHPGGEIQREAVRTILVSPVEPERVFAGTWSGLYRSDDRGSSWSRVEGPFDGTQVTAIAFDADSNTLYVGTFGMGLFSSEDGREEWEVINGPDLYVTDLLIDPHTEGRIFVGTLSGPYRSDDGGTTWERITAGIQDINVQKLSAGDEPGHVFAATGDGIYFSENAGGDWVNVSYTIGDEYFRDVIAGEPTLAASWKGFLLRSSTGSPWTSQNHGLINRQINSLAISENVLFVGTHGDGLNVLTSLCRPIFGLVTDSVSGSALIAEITLNSGANITFSNQDGMYAFDFSPPEEYSIFADFAGVHPSVVSEVDLRSMDSARVDIEVSASIPEGAVPISIFGGPRAQAPIQRGELVALVAMAISLENNLEGLALTWSSNLDGFLASSVIDDSGVSSANVGLESVGRHTISVSAADEDSIHVFGQKDVWVIEPTLGALGMAWDGDNLWAVDERPGAEMGRIYQLAIIDGSLSVVGSYPHPSPNPNAMAWDGESLWTVGGEARDPFLAEIGARYYIYRHSIERDLAIIERYELEEIERSTGGGLLIDGLTWDGEKFWATDSSSELLFVLQFQNGRFEVIKEFEAPSMQNRTIEWANGSPWVLDSETHILYQLDPSTGQIIRSCEEDVGDGAYGMAWDGERFWTESHSSMLISIKTEAMCPGP